MGISNKPKNINNHILHLYGFSAAREAFAKVISVAGNNKKILLPAFIGYSVREGSGIFDPVKASQNDYEFYAMDANLHIQLELLKEKIIHNPGSILLIVHYWGFIDPCYQELKAFARQNHCVLVEDFAHGLFTFFKEPLIDFDYGFFSLHKMFPYENGGALLSKELMGELQKYDLGFFEYNLQAIIDIRISNYIYLLSKIKTINSDKITLLREELGHSVPQTFPILLTSNHLKDHLYFKMNAAGFGVVSLYHQLISEVGSNFVHEHDISSRILNLPIHQDVSHGDLDEMVTLLQITCDEYNANV